MVVTCPECGDDYVHDTGYWSDRGGGLHISFEGECGHEFMVVISFHKGNTLVRVADAKGHGMVPHRGGNTDGSV